MQRALQMAAAGTSRVRTGVERVSFANKDGKILPKKGERNILITSALPYVNNQPHLGNIIGSTMSADVYARYCRTRNWRTLLICGTDEYGTASETAALVEGITPRELCDRYHRKHVEVYEWFQLAFDYFGRTSTPQHTEICQDIFTRLRDNGFLAENTMEQYYCQKDKKFLADRFVEGTCPKCGYDDARGDQCDKCSNPLDALDLIKPKCKICGTEPIPRQTAHYFIKMDVLSDEISAYLEKARSSGVWSKNAVQLTDGWVKGGLKQRCLTRDLSWGVPVPFPGWEDKVLYVWFDAPIGYPSITANYTDEWKLWWHDPENVRLVQFMGKDNTPFHTLFFPSYLIGTRQPWTMLNSIGATEYLQYENTKFSKSRGIGVFGDNAKETGVPPSVWRYFLLANRPETGDSEFTWGSFIYACNSKLVDTFGNFVNRVAKFVDAKYNGVLPEAEWGEAERRLAAEVDVLLDEYVETMDKFGFRAGLEKFMAIANRGNEYLQRQRLDNNLLASQPEVCASTVLAAINLAYLLTAVVHPFMPATEQQMLEILRAPARALPERPESGYAQNPGTGLTLDLLPGHKLGKPFHLFSKIDAKMEEVWRRQFGGKQATAKANGAAEGVAPVNPAPGLSKKAAAKLAKAAKQTVYTGPKTPEIIELEKEVADQGAEIRQMKAAGESVADKVKALQEVKNRLEAAIEAARSQITVDQE